jgi:hypothetical protein
MGFPLSNSPAVANFTQRRGGTTIMHRLFRIGLVVSAMALAAPLGAFAQAVTSFDGTYGGVSLTASGSGHACAAASPVPAPLVISGGNVTTTQGQASFSGTVTPDGHMTLHTPLNSMMSGKVDSSGAASAAVTTSHDCTYSFVWKKR